MNENIDYIQLGAVAAIFVFFIGQFFSFLKTKREAKKEDLDPILCELKLMNSNHLHSIKEEVGSGTKEIVAAINAGNLRIIELLARIESRLK